jgi:hypothetical protein
MTSGKALALLLFSLTIPAAGATAAADEAGLDALLARLKRPAPATTAFVEVRFSQLLSAPLVSAGELEYRASDALVKTVQRPFRERTEVTGDEVRIEREGQTPHHFSLERAPELRGLLAGFAALMGADRASLERYFSAASESGAHGWRLALTPHDARIRQRIRELDVIGRGDTPRCMLVSEANGNLSVMLLGAAAQTPLPRPPARDWLERHCAEGG